MKYIAVLMALAWAIAIDPETTWGSAQVLLALVSSRPAALAVAQTSGIGIGLVMAIGLFYYLVAANVGLRSLTESEDQGRVVRWITRCVKWLMSKVNPSLQPLLLLLALAPGVGMYLSILVATGCRGSIWYRATLCAAANSFGFMVWMLVYSSQVQSGSQLQSVLSLLAWALIGWFVSKAIYKRRHKLRPAIVHRYSVISSFVPAWVRG